MVYSFFLFGPALFYKTLEMNSHSLTLGAGAKVYEGLLQTAAKMITD